MAQKPFEFAYFNGKFVKFEDAKVSVATNALQYGNGVFGGIRGYVTTERSAISVFRVSDHYRRLLNSLKILNKKSNYSLKQMVDITIELVKKNKPSTDTYIRPFFYARDLEISPDLSKVEFDFAIYMIPLGEYLPVSKGLNVCVSSWARINDNMIPSRAKVTGGYINSSLAKADANANGFDEGIFLTSSGHVAEGSAENLFIVRDGVLITPPKAGDVLEGITRGTILHLAKDLGITVEEREIDRTELYVADEAFFSGTGVQVAWIGSIDHRVIGSGKIGPVAEKLQKLFFDIVRDKNKKYSSWRTLVKF